MVAAKSSAALQLAGLTPQALDMGLVEQALKNNPDVEYVKTIAPAGLSALAASVAGTSPSVVVARMADNHAQMLLQTSGGRLIVEQDHPLSYSLPSPTTAAVTAPNPGVLAPASSQTNVSLTVQARDTGLPLEGAEVYLFGIMMPQQGVTDANGQVTLTLLGEGVETLRGLYVNPRADYWGYWLPQPGLDPNQNNRIVLAPLSDYFAGFPAQPVIGWGEKVMRMDQLPAQFQGQGVRIAVIDSGAAANTHQNLQSLFKGGLNVTDPVNHPDDWTNDTVGHGTHCSGIIAGLNTGHGIRGFAPAADLYAYKIFPGGAFSDLIGALNDCINQQIDVVNLSLGSDQPSGLLAQKIQQAKDVGVACIVAAGNSGGPVQFPAALPSVLTVAAIGKQGEFPAGTFHGTQVAPTGVDASGYFSASFTCFGPEVDVCAPGVAILSAVPPNNFAVWDGTSMATPHVTGLAALLLAHHPDFQPGGPFAARDGRRVDRLFEILKQSAQPPGLTDPNRVGAGLPDAVRAFGMVTQPQLATQSAAPQMPQSRSFWDQYLQADPGLPQVVPPLLPPLLPLSLDARNFQEELQKTISLAVPIALGLLQASTPGPGLSHQTSSHQTSALPQPVAPGSPGLQR